MATIREAYTNPDVAQGEFYSAQQIRYNEVEPNRLLPENIKGNLGPTITNTALSQFDKYDPYTESISNKFTAAGLSEVLQGQAKTTDEETYCRGFVGASSLQKLMADQELEGNIPIRCGWRYKKSPGGGLPQVSQGALGTVNGPLNAREDTLGNGVEWIWDLKKAYNRHINDFTATLPPTADGLRMAQESFLNIAWCDQTRRFILVDEAGNPTRGFQCPRSSIVRNPSNFPQVTQTAATSLASANAATLQSCMRPGNNPSLRRDCLLQAIQTNGCSTDGTLYQAIESARPNATNFSQFLQRQPSFITYQSRQGSNKITEELFQRERGSWDMATREIQKLQRAAQTSPDPLVKTAAQDLCLTAGKFDEYDFCSDLTESTNIGSVELKCIQRYWQEQNGKPAGLLYPSRKQFNPQLGTINTWGDYRRAVDELKRKTNSTNPIEQRSAINNFLGVSISTQEFTPLNINGTSQIFSFAAQPLVFWLDANDGGSLQIDQNNRVRSWNDKSPRRNNTLQTNLESRPIYRKEAFAGIEFNGTSSFLPIPNGYNLVQGNSFTVCVVEKRKSSKGNNFFLGGLEGGRNNNLVLGYIANNAIRFAFFSNDVDGNVPNFQASLEPVRVWVFEKTPTGRNIYLNGQRLNGDSNREILVGWPGAALGRFGGIFYEGILHEVLVFNPGLDSGRRERIEGYLAHKWGLSGNLPSNHPFKNGAP
jgi:hypothetical protein